MRVPRLALLIALYVTLDFASPFIAGAFMFNADESVEGVHAHRQQVKAATVSVPMPRPGRAENEPVPRLVLPRHGVCPINEWLVHLRRSHSPTATAASISEDH